MSLLLLRAYAAMIGAAVGSFLNVCVYRWPRELSVISPRSACPSCQEPIAWHHNIPILGYLILRGRCHGCGERISIQYPLVELATALIWLAMTVRYGVGWEAFQGAVFLTILLGIALTDAKHMVIPDHFSLGGTLIGLVFAAAFTSWGEFLGPASARPDSVLGWVGYITSSGNVPILEAVIGAAVGYGLMRGVAAAGEWAFRKPALGLGDVHMMALVGAFIGVKGVLLTILLGSVLGLIIGVPVMWIRGRLVRMETYLPLGVFLAMGAAVAHGWGDQIVGWYIDYALGVR